MRKWIIPMAVGGLGMGCNPLPEPGWERDDMYAGDANIGSVSNDDTAAEEDEEPLPGSDSILTITDPGDGTLLGDTFSVSFEVSNCPMTRPSDDPEACHVHCFLDGEFLTELNGGGVGHYSPTPVLLFDLAPGAHNFTLQLVTNNGTDEPFVPYIEDTITFTVEAAETETGTETDTGGS